MIALLLAFCLPLVQEPDTAGTAAECFARGNAAFHAEDYAVAAWHYRRVLLRAPESAHAAHNLAACERRLGLHRDPSESLGSMLAAAVRRTTPLTWLLLGSIAQTLAWIVLLRGRGRRRRIVGGIALATAASLTVVLSGPPSPDAVVLDAGVVLHDAPHPSRSGGSDALRPGSVVTVRRHSDRWALVDASEGSGWVPRESIGLVD